MKPYTKTGECNDQESLRANWRGNNNYHRKVKDRENKKTYRQRLKKKLKDEIKEENNE